MIERYSRKKLTSLWSEQTKFDAFLQVELKVAEAFVKLGVIPLEEYNEMKKNARFAIDRIHEIEETTKHDVIAFTRAVGEHLGPEKKWFHYGLTSTDVVDTAQSIILRQVNEELKKGIDTIQECIKEKAIQYQYTPCIGRTHGIHADITSFGLKFALWFDELNRNMERFTLACRQIEVGKLSGAVGNFANAPTFVQDYVCDAFGLVSSNIATQTLQRDRHAFYLSTLTLIASTLEKIALEIRHLQRTEVREVEEGFQLGQKGSSAMPHKKNPISSENICGAARLMRSYMQASFENIALWHERDISHSSVERVILPDATILLDYMLHRMNNVLTNLVVYPDQMILNIHKTNGVVFSQRILSELVLKGASREEAYDFIQPIAVHSYDTNTSFAENLRKDKKIFNFISSEELSQLFNLEFYLKNVDEIYRRVGILT